MLTTSSGKSMRGMGRGMSMAEGSTGAGKSPHGFTEVGVGSGVGVVVGKAVGVEVGGSGMKGVAVDVAFGSTVTNGPVELEPPAMLAPGIMLQDAKMAQIARRIGLVTHFRVKSRFNSVSIVIILLDVQGPIWVPVVPSPHDTRK
jgi:hypothetical protein